jgi:large subunit ribosomal protein L6
MASRIANAPIAIPKGVEIKINANQVSAKGAKGTLSFDLPRGVVLHIEDNIIYVKMETETRVANMQAGTSRAIVHNMVVGVHQGFEKKLVLEGVGYRAQAQGKTLNLTLGFSHPVTFAVPEGITIQTPSQTEIIVSGANKHVVGQTAANIRAIRPPEPYKGKGVRYANEKIVLKETKKK